MKYTYDVLINDVGEISKIREKEFIAPTTKLSSLIGNENDSFITLVYDTDNVNNTSSGVYFTTGQIKNNKRRFKIGKNNILQSTICFTTRKLIEENFINYYDDFSVPNSDYKEYSYDSIIFTMFHTNTNTSSNNELFWMSVDKMKELADQNGYDELYNDARASSDRYVYKLLFGEERIYDKLSPDAKAVLDKATELVERSVELRQVMANDENHLNSWDAGYAQLKLVWKEYFQEDFKEFRQLYKNLEDRMRPLVYELGFLKK